MLNSYLFLCFSRVVCFSLGLGICLGVFIVFAALLSFFLYQVLVPGSMFRYWLCRQGSISGHDLNFNFVPLKDQTTVLYPLIVK